METLRALLPVAVGLSLIAVVVTLFGGLASMSRGGAFNARWGNRLMRLRVAAQVLALAMLALWFVVSRGG